MAGFFITGTDTGVGKTWATAGLMCALQAQGRTVIGMKPVASGCVWQDGGWRNEDALLLQSLGSLWVDYAKLNVYAFEPPVSPHLAARMVGCSIRVEEIVRQCRELEQMADCVLVEGVGGWEVPLNDRERVSHMAKALNFRVILVIGLRLGCLNHALLTYEAMARAGVVCAGWIANGVDAGFSCPEGNLETLRAMLPAPCLGVIPHAGQGSESLRKCFIKRDFFLSSHEEILRRLPL